MAQRKTIEVEKLKANVNRALATQIVGNTPDYRRGLAAVLEDALLTSGNYNGYGYIEPTADKPGWRFCGWVPERTDETRRRYY